MDFEWTVGSAFIYVITFDLYTGERSPDMSFRAIITGQAQRTVKWEATRIPMRPKGHG